MRFPRLKAIFVTTSLVFGLGTFATEARPSFPIKNRRPPVFRPIPWKPILPIPIPKPPIPKPIPIPIPKPPIPKPPIPIPKPPIPQPPIPPMPPKPGYCWPQWHPGCWHRPQPPVVINPPPVMVEPPDQPGESEPEGERQGVSFSLACTRATQNVPEIASLNVTVTPIGEGELSLNGIVGFGDPSTAPQSFSTQATGTFRDTEINLRLEEIGDIYLMPLRDSNGGIYFQGEIALFGRKDSNNLNCFVNKLK